MKKVLLACGLIAALMIVSSPALAKTEWTFDRVDEFEKKPIDSAISADGKTAYILTKGSILLYGLKDGRILDVIPLEKKYSSISVSPKGDQLLLTRGSLFDKSVSVIKFTTTLDLPAGTSPILGSPDASVTLTVFTDYQCPYCNKSFPSYEQLLKKYPNDLNVVLKHYPLQRIHPFAPQSAIAALAADKQGKYLEFSAIMFKNYRNFKKDMPLNEETLQKYAKEIGLDLKQFNQDRKDPAFQQQLNNDKKLARQAGVRGVPSLFINGQPVKDRSLDGMSKMVAAELKKK